MDINAVGDYTSHLIRCAINKSAPEPLSGGITARDIFIFAKRHLLSSAVAYVAEDFCSDKEVAILFRRDLQTALKNELKYISCNEKVFSEFEKKFIHAMPFKGMDIGEYYPDNMPRTSLDEDILIAADKQCDAEKIMLGLGFSKIDGGEKDAVFKKDSLVYELHGHALENQNHFHKYFDNILYDSPLAPGYDCIHKMSFENIYVFSIVHFCKHFTGGGAGLRFLLDLYFLNKHLRSEGSKDLIKTKLEQLNLWKFHCVMLELAHKMFSDEAHSVITSDDKKLQKYLYIHGCFGSESGFISSLIKKRAVKHPKFKYFYYLWYKNFYQERRYNNYPILKNHPRLIYFCYIHTLFKQGIINKKSTQKEYKKYLEYESFCDEVYSVCGLSAY